MKKINVCKVCKQEITDEQSKKHYGCCCREHESEYVDSLALTSY